MIREKNGKITIFPNKNSILQNIVYNALIILLFTFWMIDMIFTGKVLLKVWIVCFLIVESLLFRHFQASMRTFTFSEEGCQVSLLWYKRLYQWSELKTKRLVKYEYTKNRFFYNTCLELCIKEKKYLKMKPSTYSECIHPLSFIFAFYGEKQKLSFWERQYAETDFWYTTEKIDFISQLREWGVELEEITVKISGKN